MNITPAPGYIILKPKDKETQTGSGLYIPEKAVEEPQLGEVVAIGEPKIVEGGKLMGSIAKVGDRVYYKKWGGNELIIDKVHYLFVSFEDILGVNNE